MKKLNIKLTGNTVKNIQTMAPYLTKRQQYIVLGMILAQIGDKEVAKERR